MVLVSVADTDTKAAETDSKPEIAGKFLKAGQIPVDGLEVPLFMKTSERNYPILVDHDRYEYRREKAAPPRSKKKSFNVEDLKTYWGCRNAKKFSCNARLITVGSGSDLKIVSRKNLHVCSLPW